MSILFTAKTTVQIDTVVAQGIDINAQDYIGDTYLHKLVKNSSSLLEHFLTHKPDPNIKNIQCRTPLYYAKDEETVEKLLKSGAKILIDDITKKSYNVTNEHIHPVLDKFGVLKFPSTFKQLGIFPK